MTYQILPIAPYQPTMQQMCFALAELEQLGEKLEADRKRNEELDALSTYELIDEIFGNWAENELN